MEVLRHGTGQGYRLLTEVRHTWCLRSRQSRQQCPNSCWHCAVAAWVTGTAPGLTPGSRDLRGHAQQEFCGEGQDSRRGVEYQSLVRKQFQRVLRRPQAVVIFREHRSRGRWGGNAFDLNTSDERKLASRHAAIEVNADVLLIPDCGCGVFRNNPEEVGECLGYALEGARSQSELRTSGSETLGRRQRPGRLVQGGGPCRLRCLCDGCEQGVGEVSTGPGTSGTRGEGLFCSLTGRARSSGKRSEGGGVVAPAAEAPRDALPAAAAAPSKCGTMVSEAQLSRRKDTWHAKPLGSVNQGLVASWRRTGTPEPHCASTWWVESGSHKDVERALETLEQMRSSAQVQVRWLCHCGFVTLAL